MLELAACGAKILHLRCVEYARRYGVPVVVRSSFSSKPGTTITGEVPVEQAIISGVAHDLSEARVTVVGVPDKPGEAARIFRAIADAEVNIDMIVQNVSTESGDSKLADISFTLPKSDGPAALAALEKVKHTVGYREVTFDQHIGKVSLVGAGMRSHPGVSARFFGALADAGVNVELISTSEIRISVVCRDTDVPSAVRAVHDAFGLGSDEAAAVYGGTGR
jgi:aspartate kinase